MGDLLKIDKPIRLIELFAGIGSQAKALSRLGVNFEHYKTSEWEVNATASYKAIHKGNDNTDYSAAFTAEQLNEILFNMGISTDGKKPMTLKEIARKNEQWKRTVYNNFKAINNIGSILNITGKDLEVVDTDKYTYICCYSFPCQDLSLAGKSAGMAKGSGTRSGLLWEVERLLNECEELPQILLMENVTQVHGKKNKEHFDEWIEFLESKGYSNYWQNLNAKNFGIPQTRNRTFMVSVLGNYIYEFPEEFPLELRLKDMLEDSVDEKFYLNDAMIERLNTTTYESGKFGKRVLQESGISRTQGARDYKDPKCVEVGSLIGGKWDKMHDVSRRVYSGDGCAPTIHTCGGGNTEPKVIAGIGEKKSNGGTQWYQQDRIYDDNVAISVTTAFNPYYAVAMRGRYNENGEVEQNIELSDREYANAITTVQKDSLVIEPQIIREQPLERNGWHEYAKEVLNTEGLCKTLSTQSNNLATKIKEPCNLRIRKLTPKECWRLMGFDDADFEKAAQTNSNSQLYKQAGNSIVVDVLFYIFKGMF